MTEIEAPETAHFRWIQISDLHMGMQSQKWLWPTFKHQFLSDLETQIDALGGLELVVFSGDFTQRGSADEFKKVTDALTEIWAVFKRKAVSPRMITTPGNHDVIRPEEDEAEAMLLNRWFEERGVRKGFFDHPESKFRTFVTGLFSTYQTWLQDLASIGIDVLTGHAGVMPGDQASIFHGKELKVGLVALNSTWLQVGAGNYKGRLLVHPAQLMSATNGDPHAYLSGTHLNLIITHHPLDWLEQGAQADWLSEIDPAGRFDVHLHGHMHTSATRSVGQGGGRSRHTIQCPSLFGLEFLSDNISERIHGYYVAKLSVSGQNRKLTVRPRLLRRLPDGSLTIGADFNFDLDDTNAYTIHLSELASVEGSAVRDSVENQGSAALPRMGLERATLTKLQAELPSSLRQSRVRRFEQAAYATHLDSVRALWLAAEWGMGSEAFISAAESAREGSERPIFRVDLDDFPSSGDLQHALRSNLGFSLEQLAATLSDAGPAVIILSGAELLSTQPDANRAVERLDSALKVMLDFCAELNVVLLTRLPPNNSTFPTTSLTTLEEADLRSYCQDWGGSFDISTPADINILFRHTDGVPSRVDTALRNLEVISLNELVTVNSDLSATSDPSHTAPHSLIRVIDELQFSTDDWLNRAYALLKVLAALPNGEELARIRRFLGVHPFFPAHALELVARSLVISTTTYANDFDSASSSAKTLSVPRTIRSYLRERIGRKEFNELTRKAAELYFGPNWSSGKLGRSAISTLRDSRRLQSELRNATAIILRLLSEIDEQPVVTLKALAGLSAAVCEALTRGDHFILVVQFVQDFLALADAPVISIGEDEFDLLRLYYARAERFIGDKKYALDILTSIPMAALPRLSEQSRLLEITLAHRALEQEEEAGEAAQKVIDNNPHSNLATQAKGLLIELEPQSKLKEAKLIDFKDMARKNKVFVAANNTAIARALAMIDADVQVGLLEKIVSNADKERDFFNGDKAAIILIDRKIAINSKVTPAEKARAVLAYRMLFHERLATLFEMGHNALWAIFEADGETENLLTLFRYSSFAWRLRGQEDKEIPYLKKLAGTLKDIAKIDVRRVDRDKAYYLARLSSMLAERESKGRAALDS